MVVMLRLALISEGGIIRLVYRPVLPLVICFVAVGLCVGDDEEDLVDRANEREPVMLKGGRMRERASTALSGTQLPPQIPFGFGKDKYIF